MKKKLFLWFVLCVAWALACQAFSGSRPYVTNYARDKYQAANKNWAVGQDERGVMYIGNDGGLLESDGMEWNLYPMPGVPIVRALAVESHNTIYVGGTDELGVWERDKSGRLHYTSLVHLLPERRPDNESFWRVHIDGNYVYFQSFSNIYVYDHERIWKLTRPEGFLFLQQVGDECWVQEMYGSLYRLKGGKLTRVEGSEFLNGSLARVILPYDENRCLVGTSSGKLYQYDGRQFTAWGAGLSRLLEGEELNCAIYSRTRGTFYLGTLLSGIYEVDAAGNVLNHFHAGNALQNNTVLYLYEDRQHNVWAALDRGISYIHYTPGMNYYLTTDRGIGSVYGAALWNDYLLVGTNQGVLYTSLAKVGGPETFSSLKLLEGTQGQVWSFRQLDGKLFCCHNNGLIEIGADWSIRPAYPLNTGVFNIVEGNIGRRQIQVIVAYNALYVVDKETGQLNAMRQIPASINNAAIDHMGNIWLETVTRGVYKCRLTDEADAFRYYTYYGQETDGALPARLRLFKLGGRIVFLGDDILYTYNEQEDKLQPDNLLNTCFEGTGNLRRIVPVNNETAWMVTTSSVYRFIYDGYMARIVDACKIEAGNMSLVNEYENVAVLNDSLSLICLDAGFIIHNSHRAGPQEKQFAAPSPEYVHASGEEGKEYVDLRQDIEIPYGRNTVTVGFSIDGVFAHDLFAEYLLEGVDSTWSRPQHLNRVSYARLPWGNYTLRLRSTDGLGNYSADTVVAFDILPPWYRRTWAYLLAIVLAGGLLYLVYRLMQRRLRIKHRHELQALKAARLQTVNEQLQREIEEKNAEMFTLASFIIRKNELILKLKDLVNEISGKNTQKSLIPLYGKINLLLADNLNTEDDWKMFLIKFEQKHHTFFNRIKKTYPQLTTNDLRLCACLKLNMATKDIASLMNSSVRAVENNRYRLRKKLGLDSSQNLSEFLMEIE